MTVKELIEKLEKVEDKEQDVIDSEYHLITSVKEDNEGYGIMVY